MSKPFLKIDWNKDFANAKDTSWPTNSVSMSLEVYERHKDEVNKAAKKFKYKRGLSAPKVVCFYKEESP